MPRNFPHRGLIQKKASQAWLAEIEVHVFETRQGNNNQVLKPRAKKRQLSTKIKICKPARRWYSSITEEHSYASASIVEGKEELENECDDSLKIEIKDEPIESEEPCHIKEEESDLQQEVSPFREKLIEPKLYEQEEERFCRISQPLAREGCRSNGGNFKKFKAFWTEKFGMIEQDNRAVCIFCSRSVICKTYAVKRHFENVHKDLSKKIEQEQRELITLEEFQTKHNLIRGEIYFRQLGEHLL
ncbi:uncharacterized protein [Macrobrachium rosenbergii]|uniref:uncharacterized protein isoform X3 n=1 Tax=Macrobrachium rosenbergii TaxID=79674 RepID=UPI0034D54599